MPTLPKGGPGLGTVPKRSASLDPSATDSAKKDSTAVKKGFKARLIGFFKDRKQAPKRKRAKAPEHAVPVMIRGRYAISDFGAYFITCNDTTRYVVQATQEARYLMEEKLRFIVRGLNRPVYAVFTAIYVSPKSDADSTSEADSLKNNSSTPTAGMKSPATQPSQVNRKSIFVNKVDTLQTTIPSACRGPTANS
ncbi:MAG: hypothetical protein ABI877_23275 [Gemmatimonadaceae bacterium]